VYSVTKCQNKVWSAATYAAASVCVLDKYIVHCVCKMSPM